MKNTVIALLLLTISTSAFCQLTRETKVEKEMRMQWWTEARFGMFIHWGIYAVPARHEWVMSTEKIQKENYERYAGYFNPDLYNPAEWAKLAKNAGNHDGFCMFDSKYTDYKVTNSPIKRDLMKELVSAFRAEGIKIGLYYSLIDWHHPHFTVKDPIHPARNNKDELEKDKDRDLNGKGRDYWDSENLYKLIRKHQPQIILNDRLDLEKEGGWDFKSPEQFMPEEWVTHEGEKVPWETCQTFSGSWGYFRDQYTWKSPHQTIVMLIETVSKGGNLLLNVGPTGRGVIQEEAVDRLEATGKWMKYHGRSIYGCTAAPESIEKPDNCLLTYNPETNRLYVHVLEWPFKTIYIPGLNGKIEHIQLLNDASELKTTNKKGAWLDETKEGDTGVKIKIPVRKPNVEVPVIEIFLK